METDFLQNQEGEKTANYTSQNSTKGKVVNTFLEQLARTGSGLKSKLKNTKYVIIPLTIFIISSVILVIVLIYRPKNNYQPSKFTKTAPQDNCDNICDEFEKRHPESPCHKTDCLGIREEISVKATDSSYKAVSYKPSGWFKNLQNADLMLSGFGFNNAGGPLMFNHQGGITSDGKRLILADRNNNRVLIWNSLPEGNKEPDIVLGQPDFISNNPGTGLNNLNWPVSVATDGQHLFVADTYNNRILIWNNFPTKNNQSADIYLQGSDPPNPNKRGNIIWPWAVWTNGRKLIVTSTMDSSILIWNNIPIKNNQDPDIVIKLDDFGTPRTIGSDGTNLIIGDHNAFKKDRGNFFWKSFPTKDNQKYDFFMRNAPSGSDSNTYGEIMWGPTFTEDGKLILLSDKLYIWNKFPETQNDTPDIAVGSSFASNQGYDFSGSQSGDGSGIAYANGKLYISLSNGNKIVVYNSIPTKPDQKPDFAIGAPNIYTNTLETEFIISNPVPATDGKSLFVSSDFDRKLYVWKKLPDENRAKPDYVYSNLDAPWDNVINKEKLVLAGKQTVYVWDKLPLNGEMPNKIFRSRIGSISFKELRGVAMDDKYFYLADELANKIYVWKGIPDENSDPIFSINVEAPLRLSSDGKHLAVLSAPGSKVLIFEVEKLPNNQPKYLQEMFNLPQGVLVYDNHLFVADTNFNTVHIWTSIEDAKVGKTADIFLGVKGRTPEIGVNKLFWPAALTFDGNYLWVGEFKFSERLLRFSVKQ